MTVVLELVAVFGFLCLLLNVFLPVLAFVLRFASVDVPREWRKWQLHRAQQRELRHLQRRVDVLTRRDQTEEQETRRRSRTTSVQKKKQTEETSLNGRKVEPTPRLQRHRLSIHSTGKKSASRRRSHFELTFGFKMAASSCAAVLVLVCGLPAAGKTTLVKQLVATRSDSRLHERISFDDLYEQQVTADEKSVEFDPENWKMCQQEMLLRVSNRLEKQNDSVRRNESTQLVLFVDDNFQYRSLRKRFFNLATERNCGFGVLYANVPAETCRERNAGRSKREQVPSEVFERMVAAFNPPNGRQNSWEVNTLQFNGARDGNIDEVVGALVLQAEKESNSLHVLRLERQKEKEQQRRDRLATEQSVLHLVDLQLRQWISTQLKSVRTLPDGVTKPQLAFQLNQRRKSYLASLKRSPSCFPANGGVDQVVVSLVHGFQQE
ncbi:L-seryl-tRNA(Sec) kinase [Phytophthora citrophthora]|uniref:L-seryl-tRNA(Sec) kinase n=1 Tax=Phytophthora citrophthora TaxID=4793 RepID=A0AAD9LKR4_9STRA|nr:L-seryl-tRNA(Sec) kinase [Phytophthora citrophthora]